MIKSLIYVFLFSFSIVSYADDQTIAFEKNYYCLKDENSEVIIAFDRYHSRISHHPFIRYNRLKEEKTLIYDEVVRALETTYTEYKNGKKIATFTFISKGNEFWGATYRPANKKQKDLDEAVLNISNLKAYCF